MHQIKINPYHYYFLVIIFSIVCFPYSAFTQKYEKPYIEAQSNLNLFIQSISIGDTTKIELSVCNFTRDNYKFWINGKISKETFHLENKETGEEYKYLGVDRSSSKNYPFSLPFNSCDTVIIYFEKIPSTVKQLNLFEIKKNNSWDFKGIDLNKQNIAPLETIIGKTCKYSKRLVKQTSFFFSEKYNFICTATIKDVDKENGQVILTVTKVKNIDPSWASVNYFKYLGSTIIEAEYDIGKTIRKNAAAVSIIIWDE